MGGLVKYELFSICSSDDSVLLSLLVLVTDVDCFFMTSFSSGFSLLVIFAFRDRVNPGSEPLPLGSEAVLVLFARRTT